MNEDPTFPSIPCDSGTFEGGHWPTEYRDLDETVLVEEILRWGSGDKPELSRFFGEKNHATKKQFTEFPAGT
jgi:hypothetical protein